MEILNFSIILVFGTLIYIGAKFVWKKTKDEPYGYGYEYVLDFILIVFVILISILQFIN